MRSSGIVLDTNVLVSGLINSFGAPGRVLDLVLGGDLVAVYDDRILAEWWSVLRREKFGFSTGQVTAFLNFIESEGRRVTPRPLPAQLPDPDDTPFLEAAVAVGVPLITGNIKHYPASARGGIEVLTPRDFVERWSGGIP